MDKQVDMAVENNPYYFDNDKIYYLYADYKDTLQGADLLDTLSVHKNDENLMGFFLDAVTDIFSGKIFEIENNIMMDEAIDLIRVDLKDVRASVMSRYTIAPPIEHYMNQEVRLNITLATHDKNGKDCGFLNDQYTALSMPYTDQNGLLIILVKMPVKDFIKLQRGNKNITLAADQTVGIYNPWFSKGSVFGVKLKEDYTFSSDFIHEVYIEGASKGQEQRLSSVGPIPESSWASIKSIVDRSILLSSQIEEAHGEVKGYDREVEVDMEPER